MRTLALLVAIGVGATAWGDSRIQTHDLAGSNGTWQEGRAVVDAPVDKVRGWFTDFANWPANFPDVTSAKVLAQGSDSAKLRFHSKIVGRELTLEVHWTAHEITYRGSGKNVETQGKIEMRPIDSGHTEVVLQTTAEVHGLSGAFASENMKRKRAFKKLRADLGAIEHLSQTM